MEAIAINISKNNKLQNALTSEKLTENKVDAERVITWLDENKVCFLSRTKIHVNDEWVYVGDTEISEFQNTKEGLKLLKNIVPEPYLSAVLTVWNESQNMIEPPSDTSPKIKIESEDLKNE